MSEREAIEATRDFDLPVEDDAWEEVLDLLTAGKYASAAKILEETEATARRDGDAAAWSALEAARQMCLAGNDFQAEVEYHREAYYSASVREQELRQHLQTLLDMIFSRMKSSDRRPALRKELRAKSVSPGRGRDVPKLLKQLQSLLGRGAAAFPATAGRDKHRGRQNGTITTETTDPGPSLAFYCLGSFAVYQNDKAIVDWNGLKGLTILKYLVAQGGEPAPKDVLMEMLWPKSDPESARRNLHQAIYSLRQTLRQGVPDFDHILFHNDAYQFHDDMKVWIDFVQFERYVSLGQQIEMAERSEEVMAAYGMAEELYLGDFLEEDPYETWVGGQRERLRSMYLQIVDRLAQYYLDRQDTIAASAISQKALARDPYNETAHRRLMQCYVAQGQRHLAVRQYQTCVRLLAQELNLEPSKETVDLYEQVMCAR